MFHRIHNSPTLMAALVVICLFLVPGIVEAQEWTEHISEWERLEYQRATLMTHLEKLEQEHQKFVASIEKLKKEYERGEASRRQLNEKLRENLETVQQLEQLQRRLRAVDAEQTALRSQLLDALDEHRSELETKVRTVPSEQRASVVAELNELQETRRQFTAPLPAADQRRVDQALEVARDVSESHPRAMLSAADELEDTQDQLLARIEAIENRMQELELARSVSRQSRQFGEYDRFFDENARSRTIARSEQTTTAQDDMASGGERQEAGEAAPDAEPEAGFDNAEGDDSMSDDDIDGGNATEPDSGGDSDPFSEPSRDTETIVIESETDPESGDDTSYLSDSNLRQDLERLRQERDSLEQKAEELRDEAQRLRRDAEELH